MIAGRLHDIDVYMAFSPKGNNSKKYAAILSKGMIEIRENGTLKEILAKYGLKDWQ